MGERIMRLKMIIGFSLAGSLISQLMAAPQSYGCDFASGNCSDGSRSRYDSSVSAGSSGPDYSVSVWDTWAPVTGDGGWAPAATEQWAPIEPGGWAPVEPGQWDPVTADQNDSIDRATCHRLVTGEQTAEPGVTCMYADPVNPPANTGGGAGPDPAAVAREAIATVTLGEPGVLVEPDPDANRWGATAVGFNVWFHAPGAQTLTTSVDRDGLTVEITARPGLLRVDTGDGKTVACQGTVPYGAPPGVNAPSPVCGYAWEHKGEYMVTASRVWEVSWTAGGQSGQDSVSRPAGGRQVTVIELSSVLVEPHP